MVLLADCADQHSSHYSSEEIRLIQWIVSLTCDEGQVGGILFGFKRETSRIRTRQPRIAHFVHILQASHVDNNLVTILERLQRREGTVQTAGIGDVCCEHGVAIPGGEGGAVEPAGVIAELGHIPGLVRVLGHFNDGGLHFALIAFKRSIPSKIKVKTIRV